MTSPSEPLTADPMLSDERWLRACELAEWLLRYQEIEFWSPHDYKSKAEAADLLPFLVQQLQLRVSK